MTDRYPILVEQWPHKDASLTIVCETCHAEKVITPDEISNECLYACPAGCDGWATYKYEEGDRCKGCGKLAFGYPQALNGCCSRVCMLQAAYAASIGRVAS